jgi:hypothetical protein
VVREEPLRVGDRVSHKAFGEGLVLETFGDGDRHSVVVSFSFDRSQRKLMTKYANLTKIERGESIQTRQNGENTKNTKSIKSIKSTTNTKSAKNAKNTKGAKNSQHR